MKRISIIALLFLLGCSVAKSSSRRAEIIPSPQAGVTCFAIVDDDGKTVGGNCIKSD